MSYFERYKANAEIFTKTKFLIDVPESIILTPILLENLEAETTFYLLNSCEEDIKLNLPNAYAISIEQAQQRIDNIITGTGLSRCLFYCIRIKGQNIPIGYILLNSPLANTGLGEWSIDFWLNKTYRNKKVMTACIHAILKYMRDMEIKLVYALVYDENTASIRVLEKIGFGYSQNKKIDMRRVYGISL